MPINVLQIGAVDGLPHRMQVELDECSVEELLNVMSRQTGIDIMGELMQGDKMREDVTILVGGYSIAAQDGLNTIIREGNEVAIVTLCFGG